MTENSIHKRLNDLEDHIKQDLEILKEYENELRVEIDPRLKNKHRREIERQKESLARNKKEYEDLQKSKVSPEQMQGITHLLKQKTTKENEPEVIKIQTIKEFAELLYDMKDGKIASKLPVVITESGISFESTYPSGFSKGYHFFARLAKKGYFEKIISTNSDSLLEEAFYSIGLPYQDFIQFIRPTINQKDLSDFINNNSVKPQIKLFKINGNLNISKPSLKLLFQKRDIIVIGNNLEDKAIKKLITDVSNFTDSTQKAKQNRLKIWLFTMNKDEATKNEFLNGLINCDKFVIQTSEQPNLLFDEKMEVLFRDFLNLEKKYENKKYPNGKPLKDYTDIYHVSGMTVSKRQLSHLVVAPKHYSKDGHIYSSDILKDEEDFKLGISPIYFSSLSDTITSQLLNEGLKRNRSNARIHQMMSDFPHVKVPFVRNIFIKYIKLKEVGIKINDEEKGICALSKYLFSIYKYHNKKPLSIFLDSEVDTEIKSFFEKQYGEMTDSVFELLLYTMVILAGNKDYIKVVNNEDNADISISFKNTPIKIPIYRFIPVVTSDSNLYKLILNLSNKTQDLLFLTVGGPEHNKILELFIALHRWNGGVTLYNHSNYFDRELVYFSAIPLHNEAYVGGIVAKGNETETRSGKGAFVFSFSIPTNLPWVSPIIENHIKIVAIVGLSAIGTTLATAYVSFSDNFIVKDNKTNFIEIPEDSASVKATDNAKSLKPKQKDFIFDYINYLHNTKNGLKLSPGNVVIETLLNPIEKEIYKQMNGVGLEFDELGYELHARLWSLIVGKYLLGNP